MVGETQAIALRTISERNRDIASTIPVGSLLARAAKLQKESLRNDPQGQQYQHRTTEQTPHE